MNPLRLFMAALALCLFNTCAEAASDAGKPRQTVEQFMATLKPQH
ncbi:MAG: hypothetical protein JWQ69_5552, partial [Pseudomonas sp.]|nr:hypothetical protein [Pseudomonas sp.]